MSTEQTTIRVSLTDTAKMIRRDLKAAFPGQKISVRSRSYSGGCSIDVHWTDGPSGAQVEAIVKPYQGAHFDGMQDMKVYNAPREVDGVLYDYGVDYVMTQRNRSDEFEAELQAEITDAMGDGEPFDHSRRYPMDALRSDPGDRQSPARLYKGDTLNYGSDLVHRLASNRARG